MFSFYWPWIVLLLPIPLLAWYFLPAKKNVNNDTSPEIYFPAIKRLSSAFSVLESGENNHKKLFIILLYSLWFFLVLALMRPQWLDQMEYNHTKGYDIMLAVDVSASMEALDFSTQTERVSRLMVAKEVIGDFAMQRTGDRLGLILFGEHAYLQMPMTFDTLAVSRMLNNAATGMAGTSTAIGDAIGIAVREIRHKTEKSRIVILLTDGFDNASNIPPLEAAKIAANYGIRIYVVGIGNNGLVPYPDQFGGVIMAEFGIDEEMLANIASITGGQYFNVKDNNALINVYAKINELEKIEIEALEYRVRKPLYRYPLFFACIIFLAICLLPLMRGQAYGK